MVERRVVIVDTGVGNLFSIAQAIQNVGGTPFVTDSPEEFLSADRLIVPGVGSFASTMARFESKGISAALADYASRGRPLLGICLGMQLLVSVGYENGITDGLGLIGGTAHPLPKMSASGAALRIPHIGWASLHPANGASVIPGFRDGRSPTIVYFAHSFMVTTATAGAVSAVAHYGGLEVPAVVQQDNLLGVQFHPEKSGPTGLEFLAQFIAER